MNQLPSKKQAEVLEYIGQRVYGGGMCPSYREIAEHIGIRSPACINQHVRALEHKGYIAKPWNGVRDIMITTRGREWIKNRSKPARCPLCGHKRD